MPDTLSGSGNELPPPAADGNKIGAARDDSRSRLLPLLNWTRRKALAVMGADGPQAMGTVAAMTRDEPLISPYEPLAAVHAALRRSPSGSLCVGVAGHVLGVLSLALLNRVLAANMKYIGGGTGSMPAQTPLSVLLDGPEPLLVLASAPQLRASDPLSRIQAAFDAISDAPLIVVCLNGPRPVYAGVVYRSDSVAAALGNLAPARVGGMATPLGVYLTDGVVQGGAGNLGLVLAGVSMSVLYTIAVAISSLLFQWLETAYHFDFLRLLMLTFLRLNPNAVIALAGDFQAALAVPLLLILLRLVPVAGYHAAEHQVVHCLERGEPLTPENVRRMPRVHPRCGTNLVAGLSILTLAISVVFALTGSIATSVLSGVIVTMLTWRQVGSAIQQFLTTRAASDKQIASGIRAGQEVVARSLANGLESRPTFAQRVWNMGLVQLMAGAYLVVGVCDLLLYKFPVLARYLGGLN